MLGMVVLIVGTMPRNFLFAANLRLYPNLPWAVPLTALYIGFFWLYLKGAGPPDSTSEKRRSNLRAHSVSGRVWAWALVAGGLGIVALVFALQVANRLGLLPPQTLPDLGNVPRIYRYCAPAHGGADCGHRGRGGVPWLHARSD